MNFPSCLYSPGKKVLKFSNDILSRFDSYFLARNQSIFSPLFIVGVPRSGTTLAYQIITHQFQVTYFIPIMDVFYGMPNIQFRLAKPFLKRPKPNFQSNYGKVKGIFAPGETGPIWYRWFPWHELESHYIQISGDEIEVNYYQELKRNLDSISVIMQKPVVIKCVYLSMVISILAKLFPNARFIHIHRDLMLIIQSLYLRRQKQKNPMQWWSVKPKQYNQIRNKPVWQQVVEQVYFTDKILTDELATFVPDRTFKIDYELMCKQPHQLMADLATWLQPSGYKRYKKSELPKSFPISNKFVLDNQLLSCMSHHLSQLESMESSIEK